MSGIRFPILGIVVPCYNEEAVLPETSSRLTNILKELINNKLISDNSFILFVDDGSSDQTWTIIEQLNKSNSFLKGIKLSRNAGHQNALMAGLITSKDYADCVISVDADLQDDLNAIYEFLEKYQQGYEVVYGVRASRESDTFFKRFTAESFYKMLATFGVQIVYNHADYRLLSKRVIEELSQYKEVNLFLRGIIPLIGFKSTTVSYDRQERFAGESKYPLKKMLAFAFDGITSFSITPIRFVTVTGALFSGLSLLAAIYALFQKASGDTVTGWTSIILSIWFIGGIQLICLGLIGEYIGKIYKETKKRPKYIIEKNLLISDLSLNNQNKNSSDYMLV